MGDRLRLLSWNVNGIRAVFKKDFLPWLATESPDVLCLQETKCQVPQLPPELAPPPGYHAEWFCGDRPGYSGVATLSKVKPARVVKGLGIQKFDFEGRFLETDHGTFTLCNVYFPNGGSGAERLAYKHEFYAAALERLKSLQKEGKGVVVTGDFNIAHAEIDVYDPAKCSKISGFLPEERVWLDRLTGELGFVDALRRFDASPQKYTWWDQRTFARKRNDGWRIDYHFVSADLSSRLESAFILPDVTGSDHCPVGVVLTVP